MWNSSAADGFESPPTILAALPDFKAAREGVVQGKGAYARPSAVRRRSSQSRRMAMVKPQFLLTLALAAGMYACAEPSAQRQPETGTQPGRGATPPAGRGGGGGLVGTQEQQ